MEKIYEVLLIVLFMVMFAAIIGLLLAFPIMWTWNYTIPYLFGLKTISWGQAWCLNFICGCLFKPTNISK